MSRLPGTSCSTVAICPILPLASLTATMLSILARRASAKASSCPGRVHGDVAATDDQDPTASQVDIVAELDRAQEIGTGQHSAQGVAGHVDALPEGFHPQEHGILMLAELVQQPLKQRDKPEWHEVKRGGRFAAIVTRSVSEVWRWKSTRPRLRFGLR